MTESELRAKVVSTAQSYIGCNESDGSHKKIIDIYNGHKPLARGYAVKYTDAWCATFGSTVAILTGLTDIIPTECGCSGMIELFKKLGSWQERDDYIPKPGDYIFYDWQDGANYATTDNTGAPDHVGIVEKVVGNTITVIEGNYSNAVKRRTLEVNGRYIRGYGVPKYESKAATSNPNTAAVTTENTNEEDDDMPKYKTLEDVPTSYRPTIRKLMEKGALRGEADPDPTRLEDNVLNLSETYCRVFTTLDRLGKLD